MIERTPVIERDVVGEDRLQYLGATAKHLLELHGIDRGNYCEEAGLTYSNTLTETYQLTPQEAEFTDSEQRITLFKISRDTLSFQKGVYIDVLTCISGHKVDDPDSIICWHKKRYGLLDNGEFYSEDDFIFDGQQEPDPVANQPAHDSLGTTGGERARQIVTMDAQLEGSFTTYDADQLEGTLAHFESKNIIVDQEFL